MARFTVSTVSTASAPQSTSSSCTRTSERRRGQAVARTFLAGTALLLLHALFYSSSLAGQGGTQTIRGTVIDATTGTPLPFATVTLEETQPPLGAVADKNGRFILEEIPVGRYDIRASYLGYEPTVIEEVLVGTGKEVILTIALQQSLTPGETVTITHRTAKERSLNQAATVSARMFSVEEARRYAGGFDDPARLASSFAGVASNVADNGIVVRGNAPKGISWRMEGVEIPNPNHFADLAAFGGGGLTALSSQMLDNSDFFTGAFPAEYGNALSGVFDLHVRRGNTTNYEHTIQVGLTGIDIASEGPIGTPEKASYLFNYRYSTLSLLTPLLPEDADGTRYQDLAFKVHVPTGESGILSLWGIGALDASGQKAETDSTAWEHIQDRQEENVDQSMGALGINYRWIPGGAAYVQAGLTATGNGLSLKTDIADIVNEQPLLNPYEQIRGNTWNYIFSTFVKSKLSAGHSNKTGLEVTALNYDLLLKSAADGRQTMETIVDERGTSYLLSAYSSSSIRFTEKLTVNPGIYAHYFTLSEHYSVEPRIGLEWRPAPRHTLAAAYGLHSRLERLSYYFVRPNGTTAAEPSPNNNLDFSKAHHLVLSYDWKITDNLRLKAEPYYQKLFSIPVEKEGSFSFINLENNWFLNREFVNTGEGKNIGIDLTLEHFLHNGYYFLFTASLVDSRYKAGDGVERSTRYNNGFVLNLLAGKEWRVGTGNLLGLNAKLTYQGGDRRTPVNREASAAEQRVVYDESRAFEDQEANALLLHVAASFRLNGTGHASIFGLNVINATGLKEFGGYRYNLRENRVDELRESIIIPNISYKLEF